MRPKKASQIFSLLVAFQRPRKCRTCLTFKMANKEDSKILSVKYLPLDTILLYRFVKSSWNWYNPDFNTLSLQNVNQIESSADLKPAVYHEPENESEQKVTPPKVLQVQQAHDHVEMRTSESGHSNACVRMCGCFFLVLFLIFILIWGFLTITTITTGDDDSNVKCITLAPRPWNPRTNKADKLCFYQ